MSFRTTECAEWKNPQGSCDLGGNSFPPFRGYCAHLQRNSKDPTGIKRRKKRNLFFFEEKEHPQAGTGIRKLLAQKFTPLKELNHVIKVRFDSNFHILNQAILSDYPSFPPLERAAVPFTDFTGKHLCKCNKCPEHSRAPWQDRQHFWEGGAAGKADVECAGSRNLRWVTSISGK